MLVLVLRRGNQFDILLTESLQKISYFANKRFRSCYKWARHWRHIRSYGVGLTVKNSVTWCLFFQSGFGLMTVSFSPFWISPLLTFFSGFFSEYFWKGESSSNAECSVRTIRHRVHGSRQKKSENDGQRTSRKTAIFLRNLVLPS